MTHLPSSLLLIALVAVVSINDTDARALTSRPKGMAVKGSNNDNKNNSSNKSSNTRHHRYLEEEMIVRGAPLDITALDDNGLFAAAFKQSDSDDDSSSDTGKAGKSSQDTKEKNYDRRKKRKEKSKEKKCKGIDDSSSSSSSSSDDFALAPGGKDSNSNSNGKGGKGGYKYVDCPPTFSPAPTITSSPTWSPTRTPVPTITAFPTKASDNVGGSGGGVPTPFVPTGSLPTTAPVPAPVLVPTLPPQVPTLPPVPPLPTGGQSPTPPVAPIQSPTPEPTVPPPTVPPPVVPTPVPTNAPVPTAPVPTAPFEGMPTAPSEPTPTAPPVPTAPSEPTPTAPSVPTPTAPSEPTPGGPSFPTTPTATPPTAPIAPPPTPTAPVTPAPTDELTAACDAVAKGEVYETDLKYNVNYYYELVTPVDTELDQVIDTLESKVAAFIAGIVVPCNGRRVLSQQYRHRQLTPLGVGPGTRDAPADGRCTELQYDTNSRACYLMEGTLDFFIAPDSTYTQQEAAEFSYQLLETGFNNSTAAADPFINEEQGISALYFHGAFGTGESETLAPPDAAERSTAVNDSNNLGGLGIGIIVAACISVFVVGMFALRRRSNQYDKSRGVQLADTDIIGDHCNLEMEESFAKMTDMGSNDDTSSSYYGSSLPGKVLMDDTSTIFTGLPDIPDEPKNKFEQSLRELGPIFIPADQGEEVPLPSVYASRDYVIPNTVDF